MAPKSKKNVSEAPVTEAPVTETHEDGKATSGKANLIKLVRKNGGTSEARDRILLDAVKSAEACQKEGDYSGMAAWYGMAGVLKGLTSAEFAPVAPKGSDDPRWDQLAHNVKVNATDDDGNAIVDAEGNATQIEKASDTVYFRYSPKGAPVILRSVRVSRNPNALILDETDADGNVAPMTFGSPSGLASYLLEANGVKGSVNGWRSLYSTPEGDSPLASSEKVRYSVIEAAAALSAYRDIVRAGGTAAEGEHEFALALLGSGMVTLVLA